MRLGALVLGSTLLSALAPGCSLVLGRGPEPAPWTTRPDCTSHFVFPIIDIALAVVPAGIATAWRADQHDKEAGPDDGIKLGWALGGALALSAVWGVVTTARCRSAQSDFDASRGAVAAP